MHRLLAIIICVSFTLFSQLTIAANKINAPVTIVVPYSPGGTADFLVRRVAEDMSKDFNQPVIVENRPGAATAVAAASVARAKPDGHTILLASNATLAINQYLGMTLNYSPESSFDYVSLLISVPNIIVVQENSPYKTLEDLITASKQKAEPITYGTMGAGTSNHLGLEVLAHTTDANLLHIPFPGSAPALNSLLGGHVDAVVEI